MATPSFDPRGYGDVEVYAERIDDDSPASIAVIAYNDTHNKDMHSTDNVENTKDGAAAATLAEAAFPEGQWRAHLVIPLPDAAQSADTGTGSTGASTNTDSDTNAPRYALEAHNARIGVAYLSGRDDILDAGVRWVWPVPTADAPMTAGRASVHFQPMARWMNDPNGLCYFQGRYHMFYQYNPFGWQWDQMHWGHAVSRDLLHWTDLPIAFDPQPGLYISRNDTGGAFSGSAIPVDEHGVPCPGDEASALVAFFTRDITRKDGTESVRDEWQVRAISHDGVTFGPERCVVSRHDGDSIDGFSINFRDSKVEAVLDADGAVRYNTMAVATNLPVDGPTAPPAAAIALFRTAGPCVTDDDWTYCGPGLLDSSHPGTASLECPDYFTLDGVDVACGSLMFYTDPQGRYEPVGWYAGHFDDNGLVHPAHKGYCDYGSAWYASQTFLERKASADGAGIDGGNDITERRIQIGWIPDWHGIRKETPNGVNGAMTLPRELHVRDGELVVTPVQEVYDLALGDVLADGDCAEEPGDIAIGGNAWYAKLTDLDGVVRMTIARDGERAMILTRTDRTVRISTQSAPTDGIDFDLDAPSVTAIEVFYDHGIVEVFAGGKAATLLFGDDRTDGEVIVPSGGHLTVRQLRL